jgi:glyoxylate carboligase
MDRNIEAAAGGSEPRRTSRVSSITDAKADSGPLLSVWEAPRARAPQDRAAAC